jgi:SAM-dependent methyltransferase
MHPSAMQNCIRFFETYGNYKDAGLILDIGSQNVNGSLKDAVPNKFEYVGLDFQAAPGVDVVLTDPYKLPFEDKSADIILTSSCLEHSEMFWLTFLEMARVIKPDGLIYLNVPSAGEYHSYPVDCWRFQIDASKALMNWANREGYPTVLLEAYTDGDKPWHDMVAIYVGNPSHVNLYPKRIDLP